MTLTEFLLARIAEDEESASTVHVFDCVLDHIDGRDGCSCVIPARVLAECEAKRRILEELETAKVRERVALHRVMRHLAAVYADHPDYDEAWLA